MKIGRSIREISNRISERIKEKIQDLKPRSDSSKVAQKLKDLMKTKFEKYDGEKKAKIEKLTKSPPPPRNSTVNQIREDVYYDAYEKALPDKELLRRLPPEDRDAAIEHAKSAGREAVEKYNQYYQEEFSKYDPELLKRLPPQERDAMISDAAKKAYERYKEDVAGTSGTTQTGGTDAAGGTAQTPREPANPALAKFLEENPDIKTYQDFINYHYQRAGGDPGKGYQNVVEASRELGIDPNQIFKYRSASLEDLAYPPPPPDGTLPTSPEEADRFHLVQYKSDRNPDALSWTNNCGPASLAMALNIKGKMPPGLSPEEQIDYARALMYPNNPNIEYREVNGQRLPFLDDDRDLTNEFEVERGAEGVNLEADRMQGWNNLDQALADGRPVVLSGRITSEWRGEFPNSQSYQYAPDGTGHFLTVVGKTPDGNYIVSDPMYSDGPVVMTRDQLAKFLDQEGNPSFVAVG